MMNFEKKLILCWWFRDGNSDRERGGEAQWASEGFGESVPMVWSHHEEAVITYCFLQLEGIVIHPIIAQPHIQNATATIR